MFGGLVVLGVILLVIGLIAGISILVTLGIIAIVAGLVVWVVGMAGTRRGP